MFSFFKEPKMMFYLKKKKNLDKASFSSPVLCCLSAETGFCAPLRANGDKDCGGLFLNHVPTHVNRCSELTSAFV